MDRPGNQGNTRLSESGSGFRAICTRKFKGAIIVTLSVNSTETKKNPFKEMIGMLYELSVLCNKLMLCRN